MNLATERRWRWELQPLTPQQKQQVIATTTVGSAMLITLMIVLAPVGA